MSQHTHLAYYRPKACPTKKHKVGAGIKVPILVSLAAIVHGAGVCIYSWLIIIIIEGLSLLFVITGIY